MLKNRKGFMLVEVIVTSTIIITTMVLLFSSFNKLFSKYESRTNYHNVDALYATKELMDYLYKNDFSKFINNTLYTSESIYLIKNQVCNSNLNIKVCEPLKDLYGIETMIFTTYDKNNLLNLKDGKAKNDVVIEAVNNQTMKEYIDYVIGYYNITDSNITTKDNPYDYVLLTEIKDGSEYYYASLPIR